MAISKAKIATWIVTGALTLTTFAFDRIDMPWFVTGAAAGGAVVFWSLAIWNWVGRFRYQSSTNAKLQNLTLKLVTAGMFVLLCLLSFSYYKSLIPADEGEQAALLERYRRTLDLAELPNKTALIELTDEELRKKSEITVRNIRDMNAFYGESLEKHKARLNRREIDQLRFQELHRQEALRAAEEYERKYRIDAQMVVRELRNRIPYAARKHIVGLPEIRPADSRAGNVDLGSVMSSEFSLYYSDALCREIEELAKLLPKS